MLSLALDCLHIVITTLKLINTEGEVKRTNEILITGALALAPEVGTFNFYLLLVSTVLISGKNNCMWYSGVRLFFSPGGEFLQFD